MCGNCDEYERYKNTMRKGISPSEAEYKHVSCLKDLFGHQSENTRIVRIGRYWLMDEYSDMISYAINRRISVI